MSVPVSVPVSVRADAGSTASQERPRPWRRGISSAVAAQGLALAAVAVSILVLTRHLWFFSEDLWFALDRPLTWTGVLYPNSEHLSAAGVPLYRAFYALFGLRTFWVWMVPAVAYHVALLWLVSRGSGTDRRSGMRLALCCVVFGWFGPGYLNLVWPFQFLFIGSLFWGLLALRRLALRVDPRRSLLASADGEGWRPWLLDGAALALGTLHASGALLIVPAYALLALSQRNGRTIRRAATVLGVVLVPYAVWYAHYHQEIARATPRSTFAEIVISTPSAVGESLAHAGSALLGLGWASPIAPTVGLVVVATLGWLALGERRFGYPGALLITVVVAAAVTNYSRRALSGGTPTTEHYVYTWAAMLLALACCVVPGALARFRTLRRRATTVLVLLAVVGGLANAASLRRTVVQRHSADDVTLCAGAPGAPDAAAIATALNYGPFVTGRLTELLASGKITDSRLRTGRPGCPASRADSGSPP